MLLKPVRCVCAYVYPLLLMCLGLCTHSYTCLLFHKVASQDDEEEEDEQQAEYDGMLIESAGDVLPVMARLMGGAAFSPFFKSFISDLLKRLVQYR